MPGAEQGNKCNTRGSLRDQNGLKGGFKRPNGYNRISVVPLITPRMVADLAAGCGLELAGVAPAGHIPDYARYTEWVGAGMAGRMFYLTDHRAGVRADPRLLLASARSVIVVGKLYNTGAPRSVDPRPPGRGWISRYAWGEDYHGIVRDGLERLAGKLRDAVGRAFDYRTCVDTAPLLERSLAARAGLGWIGKNTCLINQLHGSWFFLGELLVSLEIGVGIPAPDRCGSCTRCLDACPTHALVAPGVLDARRCISYLTIELRGPVDSELQPGMGTNVFGCDICQDVCPWNRRAPATGDSRFEARHFAPALDELAQIDRAEFRRRFRGSPVERAHYDGFARNVGIARENCKRDG
ncbi:MAG: tRNA epoxyqueuosine(34) reductase QueG [Acidobacteriales bacterium]|nr:tRNA epoxyqueuosine(34) reductase QueG [Terriglobales bacterium]